MTRIQLYVLGFVFSALIPYQVFAGTLPTIAYPFDERGGTTSSSSVGLGHAVIEGSAGWVSGKSGTAMGFEGKAGQAVSLGENVLPQSTIGTVSLWVKTNSLSDNNYFFSVRSVTDNKVYFALQGDQAGRFLVRYRTGAGGTDQKNESGAVLDNNTWYHIVLTANAQKYEYYVNGEKVTAGANNPNIGKWITDFISGNLKYHVGSLDAADHTGVLDGVVDDVRVFSSVLSLEEIKALFTETNEKGPTNPIGAVPEISLISSELTVPFGGSTKISWNAQYASTCNGSWKQNLPLSGEEVFMKIAEDLTVSINCVNTKGVGGNTSLTVRMVPVQEVTLGTPAVTSPQGNASGGKPVVLTRSLFVGSRGSDVTLLQEYLVRKGFLTATPTGYFGKLTEAAVKAFQKAQGLDQVGIAGPKTRVKIQMMP